MPIHVPKGQGPKLPNTETTVTLTSVSTNPPSSVQWGGAAIDLESLGLDIPCDLWEEETHNILWSKHENWVYLLDSPGWQNMAQVCF